MTLTQKALWLSSQLRYSQLLAARTTHFRRGYKDGEDHLEERGNGALKNGV